ncbi:unnamed protein product [Camellia sinensis]
MFINYYDYEFAENGLVACKDGKLIGTQSLRSYLGEEKLKEFINFTRVLNIRPKMVSVLREKFAHLTFSIGGQISFDVFPQGWDKTFCLRYVGDFHEIHFFGDRIYKVTSLEDTVKQCTALFLSKQKPFNDGVEGSKVVVTTRDREAAGMNTTVQLHDVKFLSKEDCWSLFAQHAFAITSIDANPKLVSIGKEIVEKCKGLPLAAARTLGGLLRNKVQGEEWEDVLHSKIWDLPQEIDILPALRLSYHHLPSDLKQCFAYCSIIPNDYEFEEEELVLLWMAEGFIQKQRKKQMEDVGGEYFRELLSRSFFQPSSTSKSSKFVMHDLINDLAQVVTRDTCLRLDDKFKDQEQYRNLKKVRYSSHMQNYFEECKATECTKLKKLPTDLGSLIDLRHLDTTNAHSLKEMPLGIGKLASLQTLSNFIVTKSNGQQLRELGNLIYLRGRLCLSGLQNVVVPLDAREANLIDKEGLDVLSMEWGVNSDDSRDGRVETEVLDMLQPHKDLKELHIKGYLGAGFPTWIGDPLFSNMVDLSLDNCGNCVSLPPLGQLPSLKKLYIKGMSVLKHVDHEFYGQGSANPFQLLETLSFKDMPKWKYWYTFEDDKEVEPFTHVSELSIENCPKLVGMLPSDLPCLNNLKITKCPQLLVEVSRVVYPLLTSIAMNDVPLTSLQAVLEMRSMVDDEGISANAKSKHPISITSLSIGMIKKLELLPKWVTHGLMKLEALEITSCEELKTLWKNEERVQHSLPAFRRLKIEGCPQLVALFEEDKDEDNKGQHEQQQEQEGLPCIVRRLEHLTIDNCEKLEKLPQLLHSFTFLGELYVYKCPSLSSFPETGFPCTLKTLKIRDCEALQSLFGWLTQINDSNLQGGATTRTQRASDSGCRKLEALLVVEEGMEITCPSLVSVLIMDCHRLKYLPDALPNNNNNLRNLSRLYLSGCKNLESIPEGWFHSATNLADLSIMGCKKLKALPHGLQSINYLTSLQSLGMNISQWNNNFKKIGLHSLSSLTSLWIQGHIIVDEEEEEGVAGSSFPIDGNLLPTSLIFLWIWDFRNLEKLSSKLFQNLASLVSLSICGCPRLKSLPVQRLPPSLMSLVIQRCPRLTGKCEKGKGKYWPHLAHIPDVRCWKSILGKYSFGKAHVYNVHSFTISWRREEYLSIVGEFMEAIQSCWPKAIRQGTAGVALAGLLGTVRAQDRPLTDFVNQKIVIVGAGSAELGVFNMVALAVSRIAGGLITTERKGVDPAAAPFAKAPGEIKGLGLREGANLVKVVKKVKPHVLLGLSGVNSVFNEQVLKAMRESNSPKPAIFSMSNPMMNGNGKVGLVNQANNMIGMGALLSGACLISDGLSQAIFECPCFMCYRRRDSEGYFVSSYEKYITAEVGAAVVRAAVAKELAEGRCDVGPRELRQMSK